MRIGGMCLTELKRAHGPLSTMSSLQVDALGLGMGRYSRFGSSLLLPDMGSHRT